MKRVRIKNDLNGMSFGADLDDPTDWINQNVQSNAWGLPERWVHENQVSDEDKAQALESRTVTDREAMPATEQVTLEDGTIIPAQDEIPALTHLEYRLPAQYTIEVTDVSDEYKQREVDAHVNGIIQDADNQVRAYLQGMEPVTHLMVAIHLIDIALNFDGTHSPEEIATAKTQMSGFRGLFQAIQNIRIKRDQDIAEYKASQGVS